MEHQNNVAANFDVKNQILVRKFEKCDTTLGKANGENVNKYILSRANKLMIVLRMVRHSNKNPLKETCISFIHCGSFQRQSLPHVLPLGKAALI